MAPGACGSWLANQCESTSGTSLGQTISLSAHSGCCQTLSLSVRFPSRQAPPARSHVGEIFPKAFPVLLASRQAVTSLPSCVFHKHATGPKGTTAAIYRHARLRRGVGRGDSYRSWHWCGPSCLCNLRWLFDCIPPMTHQFLMRFNKLPGLNGAISLWIPSQADEDAIVEFPSLCFCYAVPVCESILALDSTEHTCCQAREHLLWSVAAGKLFHFDKMACGNTMA